MRPFLTNELHFLADQLNLIINLKNLQTSIYPRLFGSSSSMIRAAYSSARSCNFDSLLAEALKAII